MSNDRSGFKVNKDAMLALISAIASVESFENQHTAPVVSPQKSRGQLSGMFASFQGLFSAQQPNNKRKPASSRRIDFSIPEDDLPPALKEKMAAHDADPARSKLSYRNSDAPTEPRNDDGTLSKSGEYELRMMLESKSVNLNFDDSIHKSPAEWSLSSHLLDLQNEVSKLPGEEQPIHRSDSEYSESDRESLNSSNDASSLSSSAENILPSPPVSAIEIMITLNDVKKLPAFRELEKAYLRAVDKEPASSFKKHYLLTELLLEVQGRNKSDFVSVFNDRFKEGKQNDFIINVVNESSKVEMSGPRLK